MKRSLTAVAFLGFAIIVVNSAYAQMGPPTPAPELKKLEMFAGDWTATGTLTMGPPGTAPSKYSATSHGEWMEGNFFLVIHTDTDFAGTGKVKDMAVMGYDPDRKVYTYNDFSSSGQNEVSTATVDGDTWTFLSDEHFGGMAMKGKFTMKVLSPTSYTMKFEVSQDGTNWMTVMDGKARKKM
jgi:uncharacterized protein DUF1579